MASTTRNNATNKHELVLYDCAGCDRKFTCTSIMQLHQLMAHPRLQDYSNLKQPSNQLAAPNPEDPVCDQEPKELFTLLCQQPMIIQSMVPDENDPDMFTVRVRTKRKTEDPDPVTQQIPEKEPKMRVISEGGRAEKDSITDVNTVNRDSESRESGECSGDTSMAHDTSSASVVVQEGVQANDTLMVNEQARPTPLAQVAMTPQSVMEAAWQYHMYNTISYAPQQPIIPTPILHRHCAHGPFPVCSSVRAKRKCIHGAGCVEQHDLCARDANKDCPVTCPFDHSWRARLCHTCKMNTAYYYGR